MGEPHLAWSFNRDGEVSPELVAERDRAMGVDTAEVRRRRDELRPLARPQEGVDALHGAFPGPVSPIPGVEAAEAPTR
jgi:hypothetical protein